MTKIGTRVVVSAHNSIPILFSHEKLLRPLPSETMIPTVSLNLAEGNFPEVVNRIVLEDTFPRQSLVSSRKTFPIKLAGVDPELAKMPSGPLDPLENVYKKNYGAGGAYPLRTRESLEADLVNSIKGYERRLKLERKKEESSRKILENVRSKTRKAQRDVSRTQNSVQTAYAEAIRAEKKAVWYQKKLKNRVWYARKKNLSKKKRRKAKIRITKAMDSRDRNVVEAVKYTVKAQKLKELMEEKNSRLDQEKKLVEKFSAHHKERHKTVVEFEKKLKKAKLALKQYHLPIAILVSRKKQKIYARQGFDDVLQEPAVVEFPDEPIGTHVFTATRYTPDLQDLEWQVVTLNNGSRRKLLRRRFSKQRKYCRRRYRRRSLRHRRAACLMKVKRKQKQAEKEMVSNKTQTPEKALDRIGLSMEVRQKLAELVKPRSTLIISDEGIGNETGKYTDIIVQTR